MLSSWRDLPSRLPVYHQIQTDELNSIVMTLLVDVIIFQALKHNLSRQPIGEGGGFWRFLGKSRFAIRRRREETLCHYHRADMEEDGPLTCMK